MELLKEEQSDQQQLRKAKNKRNRTTSSTDIPRVRRKTKGQSDTAPKNRKKKAHGK